MTRRATGRGARPRNHRVTRTDTQAVVPPGYPWANDRDAPGAWACECGATGDGQRAAETHLSTKARVAFGRMDDGTAFATAAVSSANSDTRNALFLLTMCRAWNGNPQLRRHLQPYYDGYGTISALLNWPGVAADLEAGRIDGEPSDLLVLRIAVSLAGVPITIQLSNLWQLPQDDVRHVRDVLLKNLRVDGGGLTDGRHRHD